MKKLLKYSVSILGILAVISGTFYIYTVYSIAIFSSNQIVFSDTFNDRFDDICVEEQNISLYYEVMNLIEDELRANNTSVTAQLQNQIDYYQNALVNNTYYNRDNIRTLINVNKQLLKNYTAYENSKLTRKAYSATYSPTIAAAIAYFKYKNYHLSAELLSFAWNNEELDTHYSIERTDIIEAGTKFKDLAFDTKLSGSASFEKTGKTIDDDLYYAVHAFRFQKLMPNSRNVKIEDRYDFAYNANAQTALEKIINSMYNAQEAGVLVPFRISETVSLKSEVNLDDHNSSYQETFDIAAGEVRYFTVTVYDNANLQMRFTDAECAMSVKACCATPVAYTFEIGSELRLDNTMTVTFSLFNNFS